MEIIETEGNIFQHFTFPELIDFVREIITTWKICSSRIHTNGEEFVGIDQIKEKIPIVSFEILDRIKSAWKHEIIMKNLKAGKDLPAQVINFSQISPECLINEILMEHPRINGVINQNGVDEIYLQINNKRYQMQENEVILIEAV